MEINSNGGGGGGLRELLIDGLIPVKSGFWGASPEQGEGEAWMTEAQNCRASAALFGDRLWPVPANELTQAGSRGGEELGGLRLRRQWLRPLKKPAQG